MKIEATLDRAEQVMERYKNPALLVSFGKDSIVMLHLFQHFRLPVICYRPPYALHKWAYAERMIQHFGVAVHHFPPAWIALRETKGESGLELVTAYAAGGKTVRCIQQHLEESEGGLCARYELLGRPKCTGAEHPWDLVLAAQKNGDADRHYGHMQVNVDVRCDPSGSDTLFPLRDWSDDDVSLYIDNFNVPIDVDRYARGPDGIWREKEDKTFSNDWLEACTRCVQRGGNTRVVCPRLHGAIINNIGAQVNYVT
jgi:hypothetical protein